MSSPTIVKRFSRACLLPALASLLLAGGDALAQDLTLFEPVETVQSPPRLDPRERQERGNGGEPEFTLVGTSRIGNKVSATLLTSSGETVVVEGRAGSSATIPGRPGYQVSAIEPRQVSISYPAGASCISATDRGVNCSGNIASLSLTTAAPVVVQLQEPENEQAGDERYPSGFGNGQTDDEPPQNPFAAALRAAAAEAPEDSANRRAEAQRFEVRRINPEDVPPGKRLVRTPFGDRLIDE